MNVWDGPEEDVVGTGKLQKQRESKHALVA